jgi:hypothetical protein
MTMNSSDVVAGTNATASQYNNLRKDVRNAIKDLQTDNSGAFDLATGAIQTRTLDGTNGAITFTGATAGQAFLIMLKQDGTGSRTATWPTIKWTGATTPTLTTTANRTDIFAFFYDGTDYYGSIVGQNYG